MHKTKIRQAAVQTERGFAHYCGLTWILSFGGMLLAALGRRDLAGLMWFSLGAGSIGVAFDRATSGQLRFENVHRQELSEEEIDFLVGHLPFLFLGLLALRRRR
jgi:hypothetical protein